MYIRPSKLIELNKAIGNLHIDALIKGLGGVEFSYYFFYNTKTGSFTEPFFSDSINDSVTTTTAVFHPEDIVAHYSYLQEHPDDILVWGHSHNNMGVTPSSQDIKTIRENNLEMAVISNNKMELQILIHDVEEDEIYALKKHSKNVTTSQTPTHRTSGNYREHYGLH